LAGAFFWHPPREAALRITFDLAHEMGMPPPRTKSHARCIAPRWDHGKGVSASHVSWACTVAALAMAMLCPTVADAQRARGRGCSWDNYGSGSSDRNAYWTNPLMHNVPYDGRLIVARIWYSGYFAFCSASAPYGDELSVGWGHDFPHPEENLAKMVNGLSTARAYGGANILRFDDPQLGKFPVAYLTEPGGWFPSATEAMGARNYLLKGGFLIIDDWRGPDATKNAMAALKAIFPALRPMPVPDDHAIFNSFFQIRNASSMLRNQNRGYGGNAEFVGIFENNDPRRRLMVVCDVNEDVKDYWVWSATGRDPIDMSNEAYKIGINYLVYALTH
jgi:hypothetical protein